MRKTKTVIKLLVSLMVIFLLVGCQKREMSLPPKANEEIAFKTNSLIGYNEESTTYSLGPMDSTYVFSKESLTVKSNEYEQIYDVTYNPQEIDKQAFGELLKTLTSSSEIDVSKYKHLIQYDLCLGTNDRPGYRLYELDDEYWLGVLYGDRLWRCIAIQQIK